MVVANLETRKAISQEGHQYDNWLNLLVKFDRLTLQHSSRMSSKSCPLLSRPLIVSDLMNRRERRPAGKILARAHVEIDFVFATEGSFMDRQNLVEFLIVRTSAARCMNNRYIHTVQSKSEQHDQDTVAYNRQWRQKLQSS